MKPIDWDNYEVIESEDYILEDLEEAIEEVREAMDVFLREGNEVPQYLAELMEELAQIEGEILSGED